LEIDGHGMQMTSVVRSTDETLKTADTVLGYSPPCPTILQRTTWDGHPVSLGVGFELCKPKGERELQAVCSLQTHMFGWELVLAVNGLLSRSQVCRSRDEVLDLCEQWQTAMIENGWRPSA
jgi:hypothetical protein